MYNHVGIMGRLVSDPQTATTPAGVPYAKLTIACEASHKGSDGNRAVNFVDVVAWRGIADSVTKYLTKGRLVVVEGELCINSYTSSDGVRRKGATVSARAVYFADGARKTQDEAPPPTYDGLFPVDDLDDAKLPF